MVSERAELCNNGKPVKYKPFDYFSFLFEGHDKSLDCLFVLLICISPPRDKFIQCAPEYGLTVSPPMIRREPLLIFVVFISHLEGI